MAPPPADTLSNVLNVAEDEVVFRPRRRLDDADMDITPMIDITFLLLIFFLVASRMNTEAVIELPPTRYGTAVSAKNAAIVTVAKGAAEDAMIYKGDGKVSDTLIKSTDAAQQEDEIVDYVAEQLKTRQHVLIKAERGVKHREVSRVAKAVGRAADSQLFVAVLEVD
jgi:biopolymer transport protein ExbD